MGFLCMLTTSCWWQTRGWSRRLLEVVQAYVMRWRMKFNSRRNKMMVVGKREGGTSWKIGEEIME